MFVGDPKIREYLRDLPTGYLIDLLADHADIDATAIHDILGERGLDIGEIARLVRQRQDSRIPRSHLLWKAARVFTLACTLLIGIFNVVEYYQLLHGNSPLKVLLLTLTAAGVMFGFFLGYKLSTHVYQGGPHELFCGFPLPVGIVDLQSGKEVVKPRPLLMLNMAGNATVGLALVLFPLLLIHHLLS